MSLLSQLFGSRDKPAATRLTLPGVSIYNLLRQQLRPFLVDSSHLCVTDRMMGTVLESEAFRAGRESATFYVPELNDCDDAVKRMEFWFLKLQCSRRSPFNGRPAAFGRCVISTTEGGHMIGIFITPTQQVRCVDQGGQLVTLEELHTVNIRAIMI